MSCLVTVPVLRYGLLEQPSSTPLMHARAETHKRDTHAHAHKHTPQDAHMKTSSQYCSLLFSVYQEFEIWKVVLGTVTVAVAAAYSYVHMPVSR